MQEYTEIARYYFNAPLFMNVSLLSQHDNKIIMMP